MCRWFVYISNDEPCLLEDVLVTPAHGLVHQVRKGLLQNLHHHHDKRHHTHESIEYTHQDPHDKLLSEQQKEVKARNVIFNIDGIGWYTEANKHFNRGSMRCPAVYKTVRPPFTDPNFRSICTNTETRTLFAHIRAATSQVHEFNNHPFQFGCHLFQHNGSVAFFSEIKRHMCMEMSDAAFANVKGTTDSEHLAALYFTYLGDFNNQYSLDQMKTALQKAINTVIRLQQNLLSVEQLKTGASSLNLATTDGDKLLVIRFRNHETEQPPSLYISNVAGITFNRKFPDHPDDGVENTRPNLLDESKHGKHIIVASEPSTYKRTDWQLIPKNVFIMVHENMAVEEQHFEFK